jgi:hypothetical protein
MLTSSQNGKPRRRKRRMRASKKRNACGKKPLAMVRNLVLLKARLDNTDSRT